MSEQTTERSPLEPDFSPLAEADPNSVNILIGERINKIMNTRPADITDDDLAAMVAYYRSERARFILESQNKAPRAKPGTKPAAKPKAAPKSVAEVMAQAAAFDDML
jgi:hypothetical protein